MADTPKAKTKADWGSWRDRPYSASRSNEAQRRAELWSALCDFVRENQAWLITPPGSRTAIIETMKDSMLPERLTKLGYEVNELPGTYERLIGASPTPEAQRLARRGYAVTEPCAGPTMEVSRYEVTLPWAAPALPPMKKRAGT